MGKKVFPILNTVSFRGLLSRCRYRIPWKQVEQEAVP
jgi:hypothetical protein